MPFISINGFTVPVKVQTASRILTMRGERNRPRSGRNGDGRRQTKRKFQFTAACQNQQDGMNLARMLNGEGHYVSFNDGLQSTTSLAPQPGYLAHMEFVDSWYKAGVVVRSGGTLTYACQFDSEWTVLWRQKDSTTDNRWHAYARTSDGRQYKNGVEGVFIDATTPSVSVDAVGIVTLRGATVGGVAADTRYEELVMVPWEATPEMISQFHENAAPFGQFPMVQARGDFFSSPLGIDAPATVDGVEYVQASTMSGRSGAFVNDIRFSNDLTEVSFHMTEDRRAKSLQNMMKAVSYWPLDDETTDDPKVADIVTTNDGNINAGGVLTNAPGPEGNLTTAQSFNGSSWVEISDSATLETHAGANGQMTAIAWVYRTQSAGALQVICSKYNTAAAREWRMTLDPVTGILRFEVSDPGGANSISFAFTSSDNIAPLNAWCCVHFSYNRVLASPVRGYFNGTVEPLTSTPTGAFAVMTGGAAEMRIGNQQGTSLPFTGRLAHVAYFGTALDTEQIRLSYLLTKYGHRLRKV